MLSNIRLMNSSLVKSHLAWVSAPNSLLNISNFQKFRFNDIAVRFATTDTLRAEAYRIRYRAYMARGYILEKDTQSWEDEFDNAPSTRTAVLFKYGVPTATIRLCFFDSSVMDNIYDAIPSANQFNYTTKNILKKLCLPQNNLKIIEISKLSSLSEKHDRIPVLLSIYGFIKDTIFNLGADIVIISVRLQHVNFYTRFGFKILEGGKLYEKDNVVLSLLASSADNFQSLAERHEVEFRKICQF